MKIFISYRRDDSAYVTDNVYSYMRGVFGEGNVFLDVGSVPFGVDFREHLNEQIAAHDVVLVMIGPQWAQIMQERATRADDFVRIEIESALTQGKLVIPVRVMGAALPDFSTLPAGIQDLQWRNAAEIRRQPDFDRDCARLAESIKKWIANNLELRNTLKALPTLTLTTTSSLLEASPLPTEPHIGTQWIDTYGVPMVYVPAGQFQMGSMRDEGYDNERPMHVQLIAKAFYLDITPVTNASYAQFIEAGGYQIRQYWTAAGWSWLHSMKLKGPDNYSGFTDPQQPRVGVSWYEAWAYCQWRGGCLPTEAEWEWAARGPENRLYPWGDNFDSRYVIIRENSGDRTAKVRDGIRQDGASWIGALDMSGNVWEWCSSLKFAYPYQAEKVRENNSNSSGRRVIRGGSWFSLQDYVHAAARLSARPESRRDLIGFRMVFHPSVHGS